MFIVFFFFSSRRRHTRYWRDWSSDVCSSDLALGAEGGKKVGTVIIVVLYDAARMEVAAHGEERRTPYFVRHGAVEHMRNVVKGGQLAPLFQHVKPLPAL